MDTRDHILHRIHHELHRHLGVRIDSGSMRCSPLYERDVLLVCDAYAGTKLPALAQQYRRATAEVRLAASREAARHATDAWLAEPARPSLGFDDPAIDEPGSTAGASLRARSTPAAHDAWLAAKRWFAI